MGEKKRIVAIVLTLCLVLVLLTGCGNDDMTDFGLTVEEIKNGTFEVGETLGYTFEVTEEDISTETEDGVEVTSYGYLVNDYQYFAINQSAEEGEDNIFIMGNASYFSSSESDIIFDEWFALIFSVLKTIDPEEDFGDLFGMISSDELVRYRGYIFYMSLEDPIWSMLIMVDE